MFAGRVNPLCGLKDFLYKVAYITLLNRNCFIYWAYDEVQIEGRDTVRRVTRGFYPIETASIKLYYADGEMRAELTGKNGIVLDLPYSDLPKALESSLSLKGILSMKTVADADKRTITREEFEKHLFDSKYGIVATDYESEFQPINISATDIPSNTLSFIRDEILSFFGVSLPIYLGKYTDDEYTAFYQTAVEGLLLQIAEAFKITLFTPRQLAYGRTIKYYDKIVQSLSFARRQEIAEMTKDDALLSRDERRELLGYDPDGEPTRVSLNYIDVSIANQYQLTSLSQGKKPTAKPNDSNKEDKE